MGAAARESFRPQDVLEALGLPSSAAVVPLAGGASGSAWRIEVDGRSYALRQSSPAMTAGRLAAMAAARTAGLPAPQLVRRTRLVHSDALLLSWLPGVTLFDAIVRDPSSAARLGEQMGDMQRRLHAVTAPSEVLAAVSDSRHPFGAGREVRDLPQGTALIHLDWHPLNLLFDEGRDEISGIIDWDNARSGHPLLDLARTYSLLTVAPSVATLPEAMRTALGSFVDAWKDGYGLDGLAIPRACLLWAGRVMLADLAPRYDGNQAVLDRLRRWTDGWI